MAMTANMNRDPKKQRKAFTAEDFCTFIDKNVNRPAEEAALAYMALVREKELPPWALGFFSDFKHGKPTKRPTSELCMIGEGFLLLAPTEIHEGFEGTMIAEQSCSGKLIRCQHAEKEWQIQVPQFEGFLYSEAGVTVDVVSTEGWHLQS